MGMINDEKSFPIDLQQFIVDRAFLPVLIQEKRC